MQVFPTTGATSAFLPLARDRRRSALCHHCMGAFHDVTHVICMRVCVTPRDVSEAATRARRDLFQQLAPMPDSVRQFYSSPHPVLEAALDDALIEHRDLVFARYLDTPLDF